MRGAIKRILNHHDYPPALTSGAVEIVLRQAEALGACKVAHKDTPSPGPMRNTEPTALVATGHVMIGLFSNSAARSSIRRTVRRLGREGAAGAALDSASVTDQTDAAERPRP